MSGIQSYPNNSPRPQQVDWGNIGEAFEIVKANWQPFVIYSLVVLLGTYAINFLIQIPFQVMLGVGTATDSAALQGGFVAGAIILYLILIVFSMATTAIAYSGIYAMGIKVLSGGKPEIADGFAAFSKIGPVAVAGILGSIVAIPGFCACGIGYLFIYAMLSFAPIIILHERLSALDSLKRSFEIAKSHWLMLGLFYLVVSIIAGLGVIACCVGMFFTYPIAAVAILLVYRDLSGTTFGGEAVAGATPYPRTGPGNMPGYTGPAGGEGLTPEEPRSENPVDLMDAPSDSPTDSADSGSADSGSSDSSSSD